MKRVEREVRCVCVCDRQSRISGSQRTKEEAHAVKVEEGYCFKNWESDRGENMSFSSTGSVYVVRKKTQLLNLGREK